MGLPVTALMERQAPPRVSGQDHARDRKPPVERLRDVDRVLSRHGVYRQKDLRHFDRLRDVFQLGHERLVDMQPPRRIDDHGVKTVSARMLDRLFRGLDHALRAALEYLRARLAADHFELIDRRGTIDVARHQKRTLALLFQKHRELAAQRRLARSLQAAHHDDGRQLGRHFQLRVFRAHQSGQFFVDDLDDLLRGIERSQYFLSDRLFRDVGDELLCYFDVDVRLEQRDPNFAHRLPDLKLGELAAPRQF